MRNLFLFLIISTSVSVHARAQTEMDSASMRLDSAQKITQALEIWSQRTGKVLVAPLKTDSAYMDVNQFYKALDKWPFIKLTVIPTPPRDYLITINGKSVDATERSEYAVPAGTFVAMTVVRGNLPPCAWSGQVNKNEQVTCRLP